LKLLFTLIPIQTIVTIEVLRVGIVLDAFFVFFVKFTSKIF